ncbi:hypothetical protein SAMN05421643_101121 [Acinetobacter kyonggiensis]|uniref:Uncharacterized protein n=1 Tax=Acinetobacter kyonggiensis TaxID=595670 RepID=A0A1H3FJY7_9GAMM|nr:hypothetical protein SAMN05421643_101121 [Acinetobacter kyonggiensis]
MSLLIIIETDHLEIDLFYLEQIPPKRKQFSFVFKKFTFYPYLTFILYLIF